MAAVNKQIDAYIAKSADFAKPILTHIRKVAHKACPHIEEKIKWGFPNFDYKGPLCSMAAFKQHCSFGFWKASLMSDKHKIMANRIDKAMGSFGQIRSLSDLPKDKILIEYIKEAVKLNDEGVKLPSRTKKPDTSELVIPDYFLKSLKKNKNAIKTFEAFSRSHKKEYVGWINEAKTEETRNRRITTAVEWLSEGKPRNWKYLKK